MEKVQTARIWNHGSIEANLALLLVFSLDEISFQTSPVSLSMSVSLLRVRKESLFYFVQALKMKMTER